MISSLRQWSDRDNTLPFSFSKICQSKLRRRCKSYELETERDITITNTCRATGTSSDRRGCRDVFTWEFLTPRAIRRGITGAKKLIVRYNSHNSKHLKCQPELIVATRSCDEAVAECGGASWREPPYKSPSPVSLPRGLIRSAKAPM